MAYRWALGLSYHGAAFNGWQVQPEPARTVQTALETALLHFLQSPHGTVCAGRTDSGVHALCQVVHLDTELQREATSWVRGVNAHLPHDVRVQWAKQVSTDFDARFSATSRTYRYLLLNAPVQPAVWREQCGWCFRPLDLSAMQAALNQLLGTHDFSAFRASQCQAHSPVRTMMRAQIVQQGSFLVITLQANAFLHHMVRNIVGALIEIGVGKQSPDWMSFLLAQKDRRLAAPTYSPAGLYLSSVEYPATFGLTTADYPPAPSPFFAP